MTVISIFFFSLSKSLMFWMVFCSFSLSLAISCLVMGMLSPVPARLVPSLFAVPLGSLK